ncbi:uncharacterized protein LOC116117550 [Pistacia vera]|uniref:uncharacterized protein LOC116117550 n=1 Tax=Pistacia vera TaxID=55513 RepID=UPI001262C6D2|nr:uncharacterized protein LOC116117550 [Pistacia vera]
MDEYIDANNEQFVFILRYVDNNGHVIERVIGLEHVTSVKALFLETSLDKLFSRCGLSMSKLRGQGYNGVCNIRGEFNDLKTLITRESECVSMFTALLIYFKRFFLTVASNYLPVEALFSTVRKMMNVVEASVHRDIFWGKQALTDNQALNSKWAFKYATSRLNNRFDEVNSELLICLTCLSPSNSFAAFNKQKLFRFAEFYPKEFSRLELMALEMQLETYVMDMRPNIEFLGSKGISNLAERVVEPRKDSVYPLVYLLVTLALILLVTSPTMKRAFSTQKIVKDRLQNEIEEWIIDNLVPSFSQYNPALKPTIGVKAILDLSGPKAPYVSFFMASNPTPLSPPIFNGDQFYVWAVKMKTYLRGHGLWQYVEEERQVL